MNIKQTIFFLPTPEFARFESLARTLAESDFGVPQRYRGNFGSCLNAVDIGYRLGVSPLLVLQNTRETDDGPTWGYQFVKVLIEASGHINGELEYQFEGEQGSENFRARAVATRTDGRVLTGMWVSWQMASLEGWTSNISYTSMPEVMFRARATTFFGNQFFPSLLLGMAVDTAPLEHGSSSTPALSASAPAGLAALAPPALTTPAPGSSSLEQALALTPTAQPPVPTPSPSPAPAPTASKETSAPKAPRRNAARAEKIANADGSATAQAALTPSPASAAAGSAPDLLASAGDTPAASSPNAVLDKPIETLNELNADERFSQAFATVDGTTRTVESLKQSMDLVETFPDLTEKADLYLVLLGVVEKHLVSMANGASAPTRAEVEFATEVRNLHAATKPLAESSSDIADKRRSMGAAYTGLGEQLAQRKAKAN